MAETDAEKSPVYLQLARRLKQDLVEGRLGAAGEIISVRNLSKEFNYNRATVNRAIGELLQENLLTRRPGKGFEINDIASSSTPIVQIGLICPQSHNENSDGFYHNLICAVEAHCRGNKALMVWLSPFDNETIDLNYLAEVAASGSLHGFITIGVEDSATLNAISELGLPLIATDYANEALTCETIAVDNRHACELSLHYLKQHDWKHFSILLKHDEDDHTTTERLNGYTDAIQKYFGKAARPTINKEPTPKSPLPPDHLERREDWYREVVRQAESGTAFLVPYDYHASYLTHMILREGKALHKDLTVATFGNFAYKKELPQIPFIQVDPKAIGTKACQRMLSIIRGEAPQPGKHHLIEGQLVYPTQGSATWSF